MPKENSYRDWRLDRRMRIVANEREILESKIVDVPYRRVQLHVRKWPTIASELLARLRKMVLVKVKIAESVNEFGRCETTDLCDHPREQRVGGNVERHAEEKIGAALVKLAAQERDTEAAPFALAHQDSTRSRSNAGCRDSFLSARSPDRFD